MTSKNSLINSVLARPQLILLAVSAIFAVKLFIIFFNSYSFSGLIPADKAGSPIGQDYIVFWTASKMALNNLLLQLYDGEYFRLYLAEQFPYTGFQNWAYSPAYLLFIYPLAKLPYLLSLIVYTIISITALLLVVQSKVSKLALASALLAPPVLYCFMFGQNGVLFATVLFTALAVMYKNKWLAGFLFAVLAISKPQICIMLPFFLLAKKEWQVIGYAAASCFLLIIISGVIFGFEVWLQYFTVTLFQHSNILLAQHALPTVHNLLYNYYEGSNGLYVIYIPAAIAALLFAVKIWAGSNNDPLDILVLGLSTFIISPYYLVYDMSFMLLALICLVEVTRKTSYVFMALMLVLVPIAAVEGVSMLNDKKFVEAGYYGLYMIASMLGAMFILYRNENKI